MSNGRAEFREESSGTLPWTTTTGRTIAAGMAIALTCLAILRRLSCFSRAFTDLQSAWLGGLLEFRQYAAPNSSQITMLVR